MTGAVNISEGDGEARSLSDAIVRAVADAIEDGATDNVAGAVRQILSDRDTPLGRKALDLEPEFVADVRLRALRLVIDSLSPDAGSNVDAVVAAAAKFTTFVLEGGYA